MIENSFFWARGSLPLFCDERNEEGQPRQRTPTRRSQQAGMRGADTETVFPSTVIHIVIGARPTESTRGQGKPNRTKKQLPRGKGRTEHTTEDTHTHNRAHNLSSCFRRSFSAEKPWSSSNLAWNSCVSDCAAVFCCTFLFVFGPVCSSSARHTRCRPLPGKGPQVGYQNGCRAPLPQPRAS